MKALTTTILILSGAFGSVFASVKVPVGDTFETEVKASKEPLVAGSKYTIWIPKDAASVRCILAINMRGAGRHLFERDQEWRALAQLADKPVINGDSAFSMITEHMPRPYGPVADTVEQRAQWTTEFFRKAFSRPEFVGWHYCGLIDASNRILRKKDRQHSGLIDGYGKPHVQLQTALKTCASQLYEIATLSTRSP